MTVPSITAVRLTGAANRAELPLLVLGPSLGTSASTLWTDCAAGLTDAFDVVAWDLPGHGYNHTVPDESFTMAELAQGVLRVVDEILEQRDQFGGSFAYAGDSVGGCVGLQLLLDHPDRVTSAVLLCTGAQIGDAVDVGRPDRPGQRLGHLGDGLGSAERWFGPGFLERRAGHRVGAAARAAGRRRPGLHPGLPGARRLRRPRPARRDRRPGPRRRGLRRRRDPAREACARSPSRCRTAATSSSRASPTSPRPRRRRRSPG